MKNKYFGYMRVSTREQNEERQRISLKKAGVKDSFLFLDKKSGKDFDRFNYRRMVSLLDEKSVLFVTSIDRLGRNYKEIIEQWKIITQTKKADIVVLDMPLLDTRRSKDLLGTLISDLVLSLLSYVAETERNSIKNAPVRRNKRRKKARSKIRPSMRRAAGKLQDRRRSMEKQGNNAERRSKIVLNAAFNILQKDTGNKVIFINL